MNIPTLKIPIFNKENIKRANLQAQQNDYNDFQLECSKKLRFWELENHLILENKLIPQQTNSEITFAARIAFRKMTDEEFDKLAVGTTV